MMRNLCVSAAACMAFFGMAAVAQNIFVLPGSNSTNSSVSVYTSQFAALGSFTAGSGAFQVLAKPDGSKYYVIANTGSQPVTVVDPLFQTARALPPLSSQATAAALTPDGKKLLVVAGTLHIFDTTSDTEIVSGGINPGGTLYDLAVALDGSRAFVLGQSPTGGSIIYAIDLSSNSVVGNLPIPGLAAGIAIGPNDLLYVSTQNLIVEINPTTFTATPAGNISLNAKPGKVAFTPDGRYLLVANQTPVTGSSVLLIDLGSHTVSAVIPNIGGTVFDKILVAGPNLAFAYSSQTSGLYTINISPLTINAANFSGVPPLTITAASLSSDVAGGANATSRYLYIVSSNALYRVDLTTNQVSGQLPVNIPQAQAISTAGAAATGSPTSLVQYGDKQALALGGVSLPLVVQALDQNGNPMSGVTVTFASTNSAVTIQKPTSVTGLNGYAVTTITAPAASGPFTVTATAGVQIATFTLQAGTSTGGGNSGGLAIVAGQGQLIFENNNTGIAGFGSPLTVKVTDINGNPIQSANVTFSITQGQGSLFNGSPTPDGIGTIVATDVNGLASAAFLSTTIPPASGYTQTAIQASAPGTNSVTFYVSTTNHALPATIQFVQPTSGSTFTGSAGSTLKGAVLVRVISILGNPIPNVSVRIVDPSSDPSTAPNSANAYCADATGLGVLTDSTGQATCDLVLSGAANGTGVQLSVDVGFHTESQPFNLVITPGAPTTITLSPASVSGTPGQTVTFTGTVKDAGGNPLPNTTVNLQTVTANTITFTSTTATSDVNGRVTFSGKLGSTAGTFQVKLVAGNATGTFSFTVTIPAAAIAAVSGGGQTTVINTNFTSPLLVNVTNTAGMPVAGVLVTFAVTTGSATVGTPSATTDATGTASTTVTAGPSSGPITVTALTAGGLSTSFTLTSILPGPTNVVFLNGASFQPGIAPGVIATIQGNGIAPGLTGTQTAFNIVGPLPTSLAGVTITFNGIAAPIYSITNQNGQQQVTVQVPFELSPGTATVVISAAGGGTATLTNVPVLSVSPGVFETQYNGQNFAVAIRQSDGTYISPTNPAHAGDTICFFATGLGQATPTMSTNSAGIPNQNIALPLDVGLDNAGVRLVSATTLTGIVGVDLVCLQVPTSIVTGARQPVGLIVHTTPGNGAGDIFANGTFIPIQ